MTGFEKAFQFASKTRDGESVSPALKPLLQKVYSHVLSRPQDLPELQQSLERLLEFLAAEGRTNANCWAVDLFFCGEEGWEENHWGDQELPDEFHVVLSKMSEALHDTVAHPQIAKNFGCLPEQLLEDIKRLHVDGEKT